MHFSSWSSGLVSLQYLNSMMTDGDAAALITLCNLMASGRERVPPGLFTEEVYF